MTVTDVRPSSNSQTPPETTAISQSLIASIKGRLGSAELNLWYFNLGINFSRGILNADSRSPEKRIESANALRESLKTAPAEIPASVTDEITKIIGKIEKGVFTDSEILSLSESLTKISGPGTN
jgi:hypothetical protein